jgi:hypothetical protein
MDGVCSSGCLKIAFNFQANDILLSFSQDQDDTQESKKVRRQRKHEEFMQSMALSSGFLALIRVSLFV